MDDNPENRNNARIRYKSPVTIENLKAGIIYQARMLNFSKYGWYFEADSLLGLGDEVFIGIEYSPYADSQDTYECVRATIMWRRELPTSFFKYGYGVKYSIDYDKQNGIIWHLARDYAFYAELHKRKKSPSYNKAGR